MPTAKAKPAKPPKPTKKKSPAAPAVPAPPLETRNSKLETVFLSPHQLLPSPNNSRHFQRDAEFDELVESITRLGIIQPIVVRPYRGEATEGQTYEILCGERRYRAALAANLLAVPTIIRDVDDAEALAITVTENLHRTDLSPLEESRGVQTLLDTGLPPVEIAARLGKPAQWVHRRASLTRLIPHWTNEFTSPNSLWSAAHIRSLELIARQTPANQIALHQEYGTAAGRWNTAQLAADPQQLSRLLANYEQRLAQAPFDPHDHTLVASAGSCAACPHRSSHNPDLFDSYPEDKTRDRGLPPGDTCLDAACYQLKGRANVVRKAAKLEARHPVIIAAEPSPGTLNTLQRVQTLYASNEATANATIKPFDPYARDTRACKATDPGAVAVIQATGPEIGKVSYYITKAAAESTTSTSSTAPPELPIQERIARIHARRIASVIELVLAYLRDEVGTFAPCDIAPDPDRPHPSIHVSTNLAISLGAHLGMENPPGHPGSSPKSMWAPAPDDPEAHGVYPIAGPLVQGTLEAAIKQGASETAQTAALLLNNAIAVLILRLHRAESSDPPVRERELQLVCNLLSIDLPILLTRATDTIPFPKSWRAEAEQYLNNPLGPLASSPAIPPTPIDYPIDPVNDNGVVELPRDILTCDNLPKGSLLKIHLARLPDGWRWSLSCAVLTIGKSWLPREDDPPCSDRPAAIAEAIAHIRQYPLDQLRNSSTSVKKDAAISIVESWLSSISPTPAQEPTNA